jgi:hypothetical protein
VPSATASVHSLSPVSMVFASKHSGRTESVRIVVSVGRRGRVGCLETQPSAAFILPIHNCASIGISGSTTV